MKKITLGILLLVGAGGLLSAEVFRFAYTKGEKYRLVSRVHESAAVNGRFLNEADILNKISVEVTDTRDDSGYNVVTFETYPGLRFPTGVPMERELRLGILERRQGRIHD